MIVGWVTFASAMLAASVAFADPAQDHQYKPGETFKDCGECPEMVVIPAGSFMMGSPEHEEGRTYFEGPQHRVTFSQPLAIGKYAVTFDEWNACVADGGCNGYHFDRLPFLEFGLPKTGFDPGNSSREHITSLHRPFDDALMHRRSCPC